jgi:hypothetical protein
MAPTRLPYRTQPHRRARPQSGAFAFGAIAIALLPACGALAQGTGDFPNRPVRLITGSPGSTSDISARLVGQKLVERWGQQVVVDNRGGAGGIVGAEIAVRSPPDGYTIFNGHIGTHASPQFLFRKLSYDPVRDFVPITQLTTSGISLVVHAAVPVANLKEVLGYDSGRERFFQAVVTVACDGGEQIGFVTGEFDGADGSRRLTVFVPGSPNPTSGRLLLVPPTAVHRLDARPADALRTLVAMGKSPLRP